MPIGSHQSARAETTTWLTPPPVLDALGGWESFDLDPCAAPAPRPWPSARRMIARADADGLMVEWDGRVWCNPPYSNAEIGAWLARMADHGNGSALTFARTETEAFRRNVWDRAHGLLFIAGRLHFHHADGRRASANGGAPSVLVAYGEEERDRLAACAVEGAFVPLRFARSVLVGALDSTWREIMREWIKRQGGTVNVSDAYRFFARHPKAAGNPNWRAKVRQTLQRHATRTAPAQYSLEV